MPPNVLTREAQQETILVLNDQGGAIMGVTENKTGTLRAQEHGHQPLICQPKVYENHAQDSRITEVTDVMPTVAAKYGTGGNNTPLVSYSLDRAAYNQGKNAQFDFGVQKEQAQTLTAKEPCAVLTVTESNLQHLVRRLIPLECTRLQGFPDYWTSDLDTENPTDTEIDWWMDVFETHRKLTNPGYFQEDDDGELVLDDLGNPIWVETKPKTRNQIKKWLKHPQSDSAEYKMWGNSLAIPCAYNVLAGIAEELRKEDERGYICCKQ